MNHLRFDTSQPDRVTVWIDVAGRSVNVLSEPVFDELCQCLDEATRQRSGLPVVLRSAKPKGFVVGADLRRILAMETDEQIQKFLLHGQEALERLERFPGDTIAVLAGPCLGGGLELALACRYRIACDSPQTKLGMPEAKLGLMPGWGGTQRLFETVGLEAARHMLLAGDPVDATAALKSGLVDAIAEQAACEETLTDFLRSLRQGPTARVRQPGAMAGPESLLLEAQFEQCVRPQANSFSPAQQAIIQAVAVGIKQGRAAGFRAERESFFALLMSPAAREQLQRFAAPESR